MKRPVLAPREKKLPGGFILIPVGSILAALIASGILMAASGLDPIKAFTEMFWGVFGDFYAISEVLVKMIPLLLCGLAVSLAFVMNLWNIGAEGQLYAGAIGATWAALTFPELPAPLLIALMTLTGMLGGMLWALGPALLKAKLQVNEIITTLMLNYIAIFLLDFFIFGPWKDPVSHGFPMSPIFADAAHLPAWGTTRIHLGLVYGLVLMFVVAAILGKTKLGFTMRVIGANRTAAEISGMPVAKVMIISLCLSGAIAGLAGMSEVAGIQHRLRPGISPGYGYTAILIAWLGRLNPWLTMIVAFLFGALLVGGEVVQMTMKIPAHLTFVTQGLILFFVLAGDFITRYQIRWLGEDGDG